MYTLSPLPEDMKKQWIPPIPLPLPEEEKNPRIPPMDPPKEETEKEKREREEKARREEQEFFNELQKPNGIPSQQERPVTVYYIEEEKRVKTKDE
ncbi:hemagglutinin repeat-containing protein, partial [Fusobacterium polymorphum]